MTGEETREWRKPTEDELDTIRKHSNTLAEYYTGTAKSIGVCALITVGITAFWAYYLVRYKSTDALIVVIILAIIDLCFLIIIFRKRSKARFVLKSSKEGTVWVRDVVVKDKRCATSQKNHSEMYFIDVHIEGHNGAYEEANRTYNVSAYIYSIMHKDSRFIDVRYDHELDCEPYLIIEHLWRACS